jgi:hypothetical protein
LESYPAIQSDKAPGKTTQALFPVHRPPSPPAARRPPMFLKSFLGGVVATGASYYSLETLNAFLTYQTLRE